ncbi:hypothetical protein BDV40DRAFT_273249 [Aspergillus tamarii]|uniref:Uncharacterized protein n=1 Tax=Aspergillus tamarii TaxID=41984 RepID=A0A5N6ULY7_ASPTM|nr:hypothetical protein BDV40DRAFT_273249 [Aspergillus tamarii]
MIYGRVMSLLQSFAREFAAAVRCLATIDTFIIFILIKAYQDKAVRRPHMKRKVGRISA